MFVYCNLLLDVFFNNVLFILQNSLPFLFTFVFVLTRVRTNVFFSPINVCISGTAFFLCRGARLWLFSLITVILWDGRLVSVKLPFIFLTY